MNSKEPVIDPRLFNYSQDSRFRGARYQDADDFSNSAVLAQGNTAPAYRQADDGGTPMQTSGFQSPQLGQAEALSDAFRQRGDAMGKNLFSRSGEIAAQFGQANEFNNRGVLNAQQLNQAAERAELQKEGIAAQTSAANTQAFMSLGSSLLGAIGPMSGAFGGGGGGATSIMPLGNDFQSFSAPSYSSVWR